MRSLLLLVCLALVLVVTLLFLREEDAPGPAGAAAGSAEASETDVQGESALRQSEPVLYPAGTSEQASRRVGVEADVVVPVGRVVVLEEGGARRETLSGTLRIAVGAAERTLEVERGVCELDGIAPGVEFSLGRFEDETLLALPEPSAAQVLAPGGEELVFELRRVPDLVLHVRSEESGADLAEVVVSEVLGDTPHFPTVQADPALRTLKTAPVSPVVVPALLGVAYGLERGSMYLHVAAEGHAPRTLRLDFPGPNVVELELTAAGALEVTADGVLPPEGLYVDLVHAEAPWTFERVAIDAPGPHRFEDVPEGKLLVELFVGRAGSHYEGLNSEWVEIRAGVTAQVRLDFVLPEAGARVPFQGTLQVDPGWGSFAPQLELVYGDVPPDGGTRTAEADLERDGDVEVGGGRFRFEDVVPGTNRFAVPALGWQTLVEVPADGTGDVNLTVPQPCTIEIAMVARDTREPVEVAFMGASAGGMFDGPGVGANLDVTFEDGIGRVLCAVGPVKLTSFAESYGVLEHQIEVERDGQRFELEVDAHPVLVLSFVCDGEPVELPADARIRLETEDGSSFLRWSGPDGPRQRLGLLADTALTVRFENLHGYEPVRPLDVLSMDGEDLAETVELVRTR